MKATLTAFGAGRVAFTARRSVRRVGIVVGAALVRDGMLLAQQRAYPAAAAGLWELPGGRVEPGESEVDAVRRECVEELDVAVAVGARVGPDVPLPGGGILRIYAATPANGSGEPRPVEHRALRWLRPDDVAGLAWLPADLVLVPALIDLVTR